MDLLQMVSNYMERHRMVERGCKVVVAVSGGPDSVTLLHVLNLLKESLEISLHIAHLDHMFRGAESEADAQFVADLAGHYGLPATFDSIDVPAYGEKNRLSKQVAAREVRYRFFYETAERVGALKVALAHQADDQAETILINFLRGAGPAGLKGISPVREGFFIRPLLTVRRFEIERYCREENLPYRQDSSNIKPVYTRNRVRLELLPLLEREFNPALVPTLLRLAEICRDEESYMDGQAGEAFSGALQEASTGLVSLDPVKLKKMPVALRRRVLRLAWQALTGGHDPLTFQHVEMVLDLVVTDTAGSRVVLPTGAAAIRSCNSLELVLKQARQEVPYYIYPVEVPGETFVPELGCVIHAGLSSGITDRDPKLLPSDEAMLDFNKLPPAIFVRRRLEGDVFQPFGRVADSKLKDFLIKQKIPRELRDRIPLVCTPGEIVWAGGIRTGEKWKVDEDTSLVLHLKIVPFKAGLE